MRKLIIIKAKEPHHIIITYMRTEKRQKYPMTELCSSIRINTDFFMRPNGRT